MLIFKIFIVFYHLNVTDTSVYWSAHKYYNLINVD